MKNTSGRENNTTECRVVIIGSLRGCIGYTAIHSLRNIPGTYIEHMLAAVYSLYACEINDASYVARTHVVTGGAPTDTDARIHRRCTYTINYACDCCEPGMRRLRSFRGCLFGERGASKDSCGWTSRYGVKQKKTTDEILQISLGRTF